jgi:hypothetical protein
MVTMKSYRVRKRAIMEVVIQAPAGSTDKEILDYAESEDRDWLIVDDAAFQVEEAA